MKIMNRLTLIHLRKNKKRTIVTMFGILISVAMITAVGAGYSSALNFMKEYVIQSTGRWHVAYSGSVGEEQDYDGNVAIKMQTQEVGYATLKDSLNEYKPYIYVAAYDKEAFKDLPLELEDGRFAADSSEIVVSRHMLDNGGAKYQVGDKITLEMGNRYVYDEAGNNVATLKQENPFQSGESSEQSAETFVKNGVKKTFTVVGIVARPGLEDFSAAGYSAFTFLDTSTLTEESQVKNYIYFKCVNHKVLDTFEDDDAYTTNYELLRYSGITRNASISGMFFMLGMILMGIIMAGTISLIYNAFAISATDRSKQFGMLASVGATRKQKRNAVLFEAALMSGICIPLGILSGLVGIGVTFRALSKVFMWAMDVKIPLALSVSNTMIITVVAISLLTIFVSAWIPAKRASKMSTIDAIMERKDITYSAKSVKTSKFTRKIFGFEGELALKNMKRNKKQYRSLTFSLMITFVLFTTLTTYMNLITSDYAQTIADCNYDVELQPNNGGTLSKEEEMSLYQKLKGIDGVTDSNFLLQGYFDITMDKETMMKLASKDLITLLKRDETKDWYEIDMDKPDFSLSTNVFALKEDEFLQYAEQIGVSKATIEKQEGAPIILINEKSIVEQGYYGAFNMLDVKSGDTMQLTMNGGHWNQQITAVTNEYPMGISDADTFKITLVTTEEGLCNIAKLYPEVVSGELNETDLISQTFYFNLGKRNPLEIQEEMEQAMEDAGVDEQSYGLFNRKESQGRSQSLITILKVLTDGFTVLISLICIANLCNTISTGFELRRREFAMLKSVGMEQRKFNKMIRFESLFYGIKALLYGIPISLLLIYAIYQQLSVTFFHSFNVPVIVYGVAILGIVIILSIGMFYSSKKIAKENIIDGLRMQ